MRLFEELEHLELDPAGGEAAETKQVRGQVLIFGLAGLFFAFIDPGRGRFNLIGLPAGMLEENLFESLLIVVIAFWTAYYVFCLWRDRLVGSVIAAARSRSLAKVKARITALEGELKRSPVTEDEKEFETLTAQVALFDEMTTASARFARMKRWVDRAKAAVPTLVGVTGIVTLALGLTFDIDQHVLPPPEAESTTQARTQLHDPAAAREQDEAKPDGAAKPAG